MADEQTTTPDPAPWSVTFRDDMWEVTCSDGLLGGRFPREGDARTFADVAGPGPMTIISKNRIDSLEEARVVLAGRTAERDAVHRKLDRVLAANDQYFAELARVRPVVDAARAAGQAWSEHDLRAVGPVLDDLSAAVAALDGDAAATPQPAAALEVSPRPVLHPPSTSPEYVDEDDQPHGVGVGWDLSWGCRVTIGHDADSDDLHVTVSNSDADQRNGITVRSVTAEQVRDYAHQLRALVDGAAAPVAGDPPGESLQALTKRWADLIDVAVDTEVWDIVEDLRDDIYKVHFGAWRAARAAAATPAPTVDVPARLPNRDDEVAAWLKAQRDSYPQHTRQWTSLDDALDDYRLHADVGAPLEAAVEDGGRGSVEAEAIARALATPTTEEAPDA